MTWHLLQNPTLIYDFGFSSKSTRLPPLEKMRSFLNCLSYLSLPGVGGIFCASIHCKMCFSLINICLSLSLPCCLSGLPGVFPRWRVVVSSCHLQQMVDLGNNTSKMPRVLVIVPLKSFRCWLQQKMICSRTFQDEI